MGVRQRIGTWAEKYDREKVELDEAAPTHHLRAGRRAQA